MNRDEIRELHYIVAVANVPSIMQRGVLCDRLARRLAPECVSIADPVVQARRERVRVPPDGTPLHEYANFYLNARNPMMFVRREMHDQLCVLRVNTAVLELEGVIVTDGNASSGYTRFYPPEAGIAALRSERVFARYWTDDNLPLSWEKKRAIAAEVLVPQRVEPELIDGIWVSGAAARNRLMALGVQRPIDVNGDLFFL